MDASVRLTTSNLEPLMHKVRHLRGIQMLTYTEHSSYAVTHPDTYLYLPTNMQYLKMYKQMEATAIVIFRTHEAYDNVIKWAILCSLDENCISPIYKRKGCSFFKSSDTFCGCHRFDQSVLNVLLLNWHKFNFYNLVNYKYYIDVQRNLVTHEYKLRYCDGSHRAADAGEPTTDKCILTQT